MSECSTPVMLAMVGCGAGTALVAVAHGGALAFPFEGMLLILGAAGAWAVYTVLGRRSSDEDATEVTAGALLVGLIALLPFVAYERPSSQALAMGGGDLLALVVLGTLVTAGAYLSFAYGIQRLQVSETSVLCSVEPVFGLVFAWMLLGEGLSVQKMVGAGVIVASCVLVAMGETNPSRRVSRWRWRRCSGFAVLSSSHRPSRAVPLELRVTRHDNGRRVDLPSPVCRTGAHGATAIRTAGAISVAKRVMERSTSGWGSPPQSI